VPLQNNSNTPKTETVVTFAQVHKTKGSNTQLQENGKAQYSYNMENGKAQYSYNMEKPKLSTLFLSQT
jgi:hypothetical protein